MKGVRQMEVVRRDAIEMDILNIIIHATDCKNHAYEALKRALEGDYDGAKEQMKLSEEAIAMAHHFKDTII